MHTPITLLSATPNLQYQTTTTTITTKLPIQISVFPIDIRGDDMVGGDAGPTTEQVNEYRA